MTANAALLLLNSFFLFFSAEGDGLGRGHSGAQTHRVERWFTHAYSWPGDMEGTFIQRS